MTTAPQTEFATAGWYVAAALVLLQGCLPAWELLDHRGWMSHPNFESWVRMAEAVDGYLHQVSESLPDVAARLSENSTGPEPKQERDAALKILAELTRPGGFHFLKGQRLSGLMDKELAEVRRSLGQDTPDEAIAQWVKHFKPERQLDQWAAKVEPLTVDIEGPVRQALIRDLQSLQMPRQSLGAAICRSTRRGETGDTMLPPTLSSNSVLSCKMKAPPGSATGTRWLLSGLL